MDRKPKKLTRPAGIKEKVINILDIYTLISQNRYPSVKFLAEKCEVSERSIYRYLEIISMIDPVEFDKERHGYKFTHTERIRKLLLSEDELILLFTLGDAAAHLGSGFRNSFQEFIKRLTDIAKNADAKKTMPIIIKIPEAVENEKTQEHLKTISACINEKLSIDMRYHTIHSGEIKQRMVDPYGLVFYEGAWILVGYCHLRNEVLHFAVDRILDMKKTQRYFRLDDSFDMSGHLSHSWGVYDSDDVEVTVRFSSNVAEQITRRNKWHPTEKRRLLPTGEVELTFTVAGTAEIKHWIYSWMPNAEIIKPEWFREQMKKEAEMMLHKLQSA
ncbi:MAG: transcriptional regulator [Nitrospirae bacterium]|nr:transcriptional regulator [Nitrospirota bacterium]MCL5977298.1 transcriptional regulator [Nitrospirota bacterium]